MTLKLYFDDADPITAAMVHVGMLLIDHGVVPPDSHLTRTDLSQITGLSELRLGKDLELTKVEEAFVRQRLETLS